MLEEDGERIYLASKCRLTAHSNGHRALRSYGSCGSRGSHMAPRANIRIVKHQVQRGDTLQGIALKYGVTMEEVKRENRLWTTDSLFLREFLDIPVPSSSSPTGDASLPRQASPSPQRTVSLDAVGTDSAAAAAAAAAGGDENIRDFLGRIDTSIKKTKSQIKELNLTDDDNNDEDSSYSNSQCPPSVPGLTLSPAMDSVSYQNGSYSSLGDLSNGRGYSNVDFSPKTTVVTSGRKVKTSLQKHRREHEQMFEL